MNLDDEDRAKSAILGILFVLGCLGLLALEFLVFWFSCLRENQAFWTNAGGYPVGLRESVLTFYYPLLALNAILLGLATFGFIARLKPPYSMLGLQACVLLVCWGVFFGSAAVSWANNLLNFLEGRPIHYHKDRPQIHRVVQ